MNYLKSVLVGLAATIVAVALFLAVMLGIAIAASTPEGALVVAVIVRPDHVLLVAVMGFALGFGWSVTKQRRRRPA